MCEYKIHYPLKCCTFYESQTSELHDACRYLVAQTCSSLQQGLPGVFINNQPTDLWRNGLFGWRIWVAVPSQWAFLTWWRRWYTFWSRWRTSPSFHITAVIIHHMWGITLSQNAAFGCCLKYRFIMNLMQNCKVKATGSHKQRTPKRKTSPQHLCDKYSIYVATGGHSEFINWWFSKPCQPLWFKMHSCPYIVGDLPSGHCCHINACFWTFSSLKVCHCSLEIPRSPGSGLTLTEWMRVSGKEDQDWNQWDSYTHLSAALQIQNEMDVCGHEWKPTNICLISTSHILSMSAEPNKIV